MTVHPESTSDENTPIVDMTEKVVAQLIEEGKKRGFVTYDEINKALPSDRISSDLIEDVMTTLADLGISVEENEDGGDDENAPAAKAKKTPSGNIDADTTGRTDDPVRMYLREMGGVELLSREGEIVIAKRIEAGQEMMIEGICESPLTLKAIAEWRDDLIEGNLLLRDIIDLDATYNKENGTGNFQEPTEETTEETAETAETAEEVKPEDAEEENDTDSEASEGTGEEGEAKEGEEGEAKEGEEEDEDDDDFDDDEDVNVSLAAMEEELKPAILEVFDNISKTYGELSRIQEKRLDTLGKGKEITAKTEKKYIELRDDLVTLVKQVRLNGLRVEALVNHLKALNSSLTKNEGTLMRLADKSGVKRKKF
ncbi:MAG: RNA polymerase sigma factor region1.1 domain-containing protein, partial [Alphaproteobacteria bacterium]